MKIKFIACLTVILLSLGNNVVAGKRPNALGSRRYLPTSGHVATPGSSELAQLTQNPAFKLESSLLQLVSQSSALCSRSRGMQDTLQDFCRQIVNDCSTMLTTLERYCKRVSASTIDEQLKKDYISRAQELESKISAHQEKYMTTLAQLINPYLKVTPIIYETEEGQ